MHIARCIEAVERYSGNISRSVDIPHPDRQFTSKARRIQDHCWPIFLCVETREVTVSLMTHHPKSACVMWLAGAATEQNADGC